MARDFNNLRTVIIDNLDLLQDALQLNPNAQEMAKLALQASLRGSDLTSQLLFFPRRQTLEVTAIELDEIVSGTLDLLRSTRGTQFAIELHPADCLRRPSSGPILVTSAPTNPATNAPNAMPHAVPKL